MTLPTCRCIMKTRDMSKAQFDQRTRELGFRTDGFMGYYRLPEPFSNCSVSIFNAGPSRRAQLAYLLREFERHQKQHTLPACPVSGPSATTVSNQRGAGGGF